MHRSLPLATLAVLIALPMAAQGQADSVAAPPSESRDAVTDVARARERLRLPPDPVLAGLAAPGKPHGIEAHDLNPLELARRRQFAGAGAVVGAVGATVWAVRSIGDDGLSRGLAVLLAPVILPIPMFAGAVVGGVAGYGISFVVYPPR